MTPLQLAQSTGARIDRATEWLSVIEFAMLEFGIDTRLRQAMFLAQIGHESGGLHYVIEIWGNTAAQLRYEGRKDLGNTEAGDGFKFRGRSFIQITGRFNYIRTSKALGVDFVTDPEKLEKPEHGARASAEWWQSHNLNRFADIGDIVGCTKVINGGTNGLDQRTKLYQAALQAIPEIVAKTTPVKQEPHIEATNSMTAIMRFIEFVLKFFSKKP